MIKNFMLVGAGGFIGSMLRYGIGEILSSSVLKFHLPAATITVNLMGCFLIGLLAGFSGSRFDFSPGMRIFLMTGVLGGFTTFSAFALDNFRIMSDHHPYLLLANILLQVAGGIVLCGAGFSLSTHV